MKQPGFYYRSKGRRVFPFDIAITKRKRKKVIIFKFKDKDIPFVEILKFVSTMAKSMKGDICLVAHGLDKTGSKWAPKMHSVDFSKQPLSKEEKMIQRPFDKANKNKINK